MADRVNNRFSFLIENLKSIWEISLMRESLGSYANPFIII